MAPQQRKISLATEMRELALLHYTNDLAAIAAIVAIVAMCKESATNGKFEIVVDNIPHDGIIVLLRDEGFKVARLANFDTNETRHSISW